MKLDRSSAVIGNEEDLGAHDAGKIDMKYLELFNEDLMHLSTCPQNSIRNTNQCKQCLAIVLNTLHVLDQVRLNSICEDCGEIGCDYCDDEELDVSNELFFSPPKHISIRLSISKTKKIKSHEEQIETLNNNIQNLRRELNYFQRSSEERSSLRIYYRQEDPIIDELKSKVDKLKQKMEDLNYATYDGSLIWPIKEFKRKFSEAESEQQTSLYSPVFFSSPTGYKMRARLDPHGDGIARGTHISVFLIICPGEFDPTLTWPFQFQVTFCLFDQTGRGNHIVDSFSPDPTSASFQQPHSKENTASGILQFLPIAVLQRQESDYVREDTLYIKVTVNPSKAPTAVLPYTLSINPGLPPFEQNVIRARMIEQHNQIESQLAAQIQGEDQQVTDQSLIPVHPLAPTENSQEPPSSTTNLDLTSCEDIPNKS